MQRSLFISPEIRLSVVRKEIIENGLPTAEINFSNYVSRRSKKGWRKIYVTIDVVLSPTL